MTEVREIRAYPHPNCSQIDAFGDSLHLAIGMFDGVHLGHRSVIQQAVDSARGSGHSSAVLTFNPHPSVVLYPAKATRMLMNLRDRIRRIHAIGADVVFVQNFTRQYADKDAVEFVPMLVDNFPGLKSIHVGENFRFGAGRRGTIETLRQTAALLDIELHAVERKVLDGMAISSSRIRADLMEGAIDEVNAMLGEPYTINGRIIKGKGIGKKLNFPTLNIPWQPEVAPRFGVYRIKLIRVPDGEAQNGIANYGLRPTVEVSSDPVLEVHLLEGDCLQHAGDQVEVQLLEFVRPETEFETLESLRLQIEEDILFVRNRLKESQVTR